MAFASLEGAEENEALAEINMVPLIDVMLVLLIIFMVTAPLLTHTVRVDLPKASSTVVSGKTPAVRLGIDANSGLSWNAEAISAEQLIDRLKATSSLQPQPELHIHAERTTPYEKVAQVMSEAARQGLVRIGFVTDPTGAAR